MSTTRRTLAGRLFAALAASAATWRATASEASAEAPKVPHVVYHLNEIQKVHFVLGNMANHVAGMGGPDKVALTLVVHGPALEYFRKVQADGNLTARTAALLKGGATLVACGNTMKGANLSLADLVPGFVVAEEGGVVRIARLQAEGYAYLRP
ncbi:MAG: DsrE family protein [Ancalomicrobiaceae bacterium]|nr:DsrE family protein [Ancalomicrobiaceae bacterium]